MDVIKINKDEVLILKTESLLHPRDLEKVRNDVIRQIKGGAVIIPNNFTFTICKRDSSGVEGQTMNQNDWIAEYVKEKHPEILTTVDFFIYRTAAAMRDFTNAVVDGIKDIDFEALAKIINEIHTIKEEAEQEDKQ